MRVYEYEYVKIELMNLLHACRNDYDSIVDASDQFLCDDLENDGVCNFAVVDDDEHEQHEDKCLDDNVCNISIHIKEYTKEYTKEDTKEDTKEEIKEDTKKDTKEFVTSKLNLHKIKKILEKNEKETSNSKNISIHKKLNSIVKKITKQIKVEFTKDIISYGNILETYSNSSGKKKNNIDGILNTFYRLILSKINSKN